MANRKLTVDEVIEMLDADDEMTMGEVYDPPMKITDPHEAQRFLTALCGNSMRLFKARDEEKTEAEILDIARANLGYYAGYSSNETRQRVERVFNCAHPIFGKASGGTPTAEEAFEMGKASAE